MKRVIVACIAALCAALIVNACGAAPPPTTPTRPPSTPTQPGGSTTAVVTNIVISGVDGRFSAYSVVGASSQLTATALYSDASRADITVKADWQSSNTAILTVNASGQATGVGPGQSYVRATYGGVTGEIGVYVAPPVVSPGAAACGFDGPTGSQNHDWEARSDGSLLVLTGQGCAWTATTDAGWITLNGPASTGGIGGLASGAISYSLSEFEYSTAPPRVGHITVRSSTSGATRTTDVTQWANCTGPPTERPLSFGADGGRSDHFQVLLGAPAVCRWRIISDADWITILGSPTTVLMKGDADLYIVAKPNVTPSSRTTRVYADYVTYVVTQAGR